MHAHINACSLNKNFDGLQHLLIGTYKFLINAITETRIAKNVSLTSNLTVNIFSFEFTSAESSVVGTLLYIANVSYKRL